MAQVHRAVNANSGLQRPVALKRMLSHIAKSEDMVKSFVREARLASYLRHENVAQTYELGRVGDVYFIAMELVTGRNLREVLRHCGVTTGPMPVPIALNILNQVCDALDYAHNLCDESGEPLGLVHRDVSPSNVIVSASGVAKLIDFGIAKASGGGMQTMSGTLKGKFAYMAPEYIGGRLDARADLFAVGVIAHELLTNRPLFAGRDDIDTLTRVREMRIEPPSKKNPLVPPEIDDIVMTALARDPDRRWQHATALRTALTTLTKRLGLIAGNLQVVQWLDWAFAHAPKPASRAQTDTDLDAEPITLDPSISIEHRTVDLSASSQRMTVVSSINPDPPAETPVGTPAFVPAQRVSPAAIAELAQAAADAANRQPRAPQAVTPMASLPPYQGRVPASPPPLAATTAPSSAAPASGPGFNLPIAPGAKTMLAPPGSQSLPAPVPAIQGSQAIPTHVVPGLQAPVPLGGKTFLSTPSPRPQTVPSAPSTVLGSQAMPPMAAPNVPVGLGGKTFRSSPAPAPQSPPAPSLAGGQSSVASSGGHSVPSAAGNAPGSGPHVASGPRVPSRNAAPFGAPRPTPSAGAPMPGSRDAMRSAMAARDLAQRAPATIPPPAPTEPRSGSRLLTVLLVLVAAGAAAIAVYFVLPLLTSR
jgi:serine/threonine protein kinase